VAAGTLAEAVGDLQKQHDLRSADRRWQVEILFRADCAKRSGGRVSANAARNRQIREVGCGWPLRLP